MKPKDFSNIDFGDGVKKFIPYERRKSIAIILGAGFSAPKGYPIGNTINDAILNFNEFPVDFAPSGEISTSNDGKLPQFQIYGMDLYQKQFAFCKRVIGMYSSINERFDYEQFFDFIKSPYIFDERYRILCKDFIDKYNDYQSFVDGLIPIYNQMVAYLIHDMEGKCWYDGEPSHIGYFDGYDSFLKTLQKLSEENIVHVHTLNHDMLFESFGKTEYLSGKISDGFDEYRSPYYGVLEKENAHYKVRLERYIGLYNTSVRLYKLHGSLNYVLYYKTSKEGILLPDKYVKIRKGISPGYLLKENKSKRGYELFPFATHADFLTGTTSKILRYREPLLYRKLFKNFTKNLQNAEILIIIGYGFKDIKINDIILENFDFLSKRIYIVDPKLSQDAKNFAWSTHAIIIDKSVSEVDFNSIFKY